MKSRAKESRDGKHLSSMPAITKWKDLDYLLKVADSRAFDLRMEARAHDHRGAPRTQPCGTSATRPDLAQHAVFDQIPELMEDIRVPDYCALGEGDMKSVLGQKYVRQYSPQLSKQLHPFSEFMLCNSSQVDLDIRDYQKYPAYRKLSCMDYILEEGDMLHITPTWRHYVRSLSRSFSVGFWWAVSSSDEDSEACGSFV